MDGEVTALKSSIKRRGKVEVTLDGRRSFEIARTLAFELEVGEFLSEARIRELKDRDMEETIFQQAVRQISRRPRSEQELRTSFSRRRIRTQSQDCVLQRLHEAGLVDDGAFAKAWVENRSAFRPRSAWALRYELTQKGISQELIENALKDFDDEQAAQNAARVAARKLRDLDWDAFRARLAAHLSRRGFQYSTISPVVKCIWDEMAGGNEESEVEQWK